MNSVSVYGTRALHLPIFGSKDSKQHILYHRSKKLANAERPLEGHLPIGAK